jgi:hypothetical protein
MSQLLNFVKLLYKVRRYCLTLKREGLIMTQKLYLER